MSTDLDVIKLLKLTASMSILPVCADFLEDLKQQKEESYISLSKETREKARKLVIRIRKFDSLLMEKQNLKCVDEQIEIQRKFRNRFKFIDKLKIVSCSLEIILIHLLEIEKTNEITIIPVEFYKNIFTFLKELKKEVTFDSFEVENIKKEYLRLLNSNL